MMKYTSLVLSASLLGMTNAECPNACSSHGICTNYDMCQCYRNWMANDCSERVCQFGLAHVDTPKGDLDASSGALSGPEDTVIVNSQVYPYGTTEQFPNMVNSNGAVLDNTAHYYMECSNKGTCNRQTGTCECFPGYDGAACQRASCPSNADGVCSGHGTCQSIKELSNNDYNNIYELWDKSATLGCDCDAGYYGADCSLRQCKYGVDPLYIDDGLATPRYANWTYGFYTTASATISGNYSIVFYDVFGEDWRTDAIQYSDSCDTITNKLEGLPNDVIPKESVLCFEYTNPGTTLSGKAPTASSGTYNWQKLVTLVFSGNPGQLQQIDIDIYLDGPRPTLVSSETTSTLGSFVYANGFHGEFIDYVSDYCEGVEVTLDQSHVRLDGVSTSEAILLKRCLGDSDGNTANNANDIYNWDYGSIEHPHLIKLVEATAHPNSRICNTSNLYYAPLGANDWCENDHPAGFYLPIVYDTVTNYFYYVGQLNTVYSSSTPFRVFTTTGRLELVNYDREIEFLDGPFSNQVAYWNSTDASDAMDCETRRTSAKSCLNKGDRVMFFNLYTFSHNPEFHNIYTVKRVGRDRHPTTYSAITTIELDMGINFGHVPDIYVYKFWPSTGSSWAAECSDRGVCDTSSGICKCFRGYTSDDCSVQNTFAK
mmetsp:Transcript_21332/g.22053  ORF Transcript_21332/g.22053 Transcript_21332/m.22053 type:complete len:655 (+) Transcript_21332:61-2025(+)